VSNATIFHQRVLVMHTNPIVAIGLQACLAELPNHEVVIADVGSAQGRINVIVCDEPSSQLLEHERQGAAVVMLARRPRSVEIQRALKRGVLGYVAESSSPEEISAAVLAGERGCHFLCRLSAQEMANDLINKQLTDRECAVLVSLSRGSCNKAIAKELDIAIGTVKAHVRSIMGKLNASSRTEAASIAMERGFVPEPAFN